MTNLYNEEIIDGHMHLWDLTHGEYPWLQEEAPFFKKIVGDYKKIRQDFLIDDYKALIKPHNVVKSVHIESKAAPIKSLHETEWLQKIADNHGFPHAIVPYADLRDPDIENVLKDLCQFPNVRGIRHLIYGTDLARDPLWNRGLRHFASQNLIFELGIFGDQIPDVAKIIKEHSDVHFVLEHLGWPLDVSDAGFKKWKEDIALMDSYPNAHLKLSGIGLVFQGPDTENITRFVRAGIESFGVDRCFFGSCVSPDTLFLNCDQIINIFKEALSIYDPKSQRKLFYENAKTFYDI